MTAVIYQYHLDLTQAFRSVLETSSSAKLISVEYVKTDSMEYKITFEVLP